MGLLYALIDSSMVRNLLTKLPLYPSISLDILQPVLFGLIVAFGF